MFIYNKKAPIDSYLPKIFWGPFILFFAGLAYYLSKYNFFLILRYDSIFGICLVPVFLLLNAISALLFVAGILFVLAYVLLLVELITATARSSITPMSMSIFVILSVSIICISYRIIPVSMDKKIIYFGDDNYNGVNQNKEQKLVIEKLKTNKTVTLFFDLINIEDKNNEIKFLEADSVYDRAAIQQYAFKNIRDKIGTIDMPMFEINTFTKQCVVTVTKAGFEKLKYNKHCRIVSILDDNYQYKIQAQKAIEKAEYEKAIDIYKNTFKSDSDLVNVYILRSNDYKRKEQYPEALDDCNRAIEIDPENQQAYLARAIIYGSLRRIDEYKADMDIVVAINKAQKEKTLDRTQR
jgi:tetratricopeptide (TPR) repeat protein